MFKFYQVTVIQNYHSTYFYVMQKHVNKNKNTEIQKVTFKDKSIKKIFGPINEHRLWRIKHNREIQH